MRKIFVYAVLVCVIGLVIYVWASQSAALLLQGTAATYLSIGRLAGLLLALCILFQFVVIGRVGWIERIFGLDKLARLHHWTGFCTVLFLIAHPVFVTLSYGWGSGDSFVRKLASLAFVSGDETLHAAMSASLLVIIVTASLFVVLKKLRYEYWYGIHLLVYAAIAFSFSHQTELGGDLQTALPRTLWIGLYACAGVIYVWFRFVKPIYTYTKHRFTVLEVTRETHNVYAIHIGGKNINVFTYNPGQFIIVRFFARGVWYEAHPFSISGRGKDGSIRITIKASGDFTKKLPKKVNSGTPVFIDGPHGVFGKTISSEEKILCIAGGIGITPMVPLVKQAARLGKDIKVLASFRETRDAVYQKELQNTAGDSNVRVVYTDEPGSVRRETIDEKLLKEFCPDIAQRSVYVCGPIPFMRLMQRTTQVLGVPKYHIHYERFSL